MRVLLVNPPYQTLTSNVGVGHQVPLGLLAVGGPLVDDGHDVRLLDAEARRLSPAAVARAAAAFGADVVMTGHAGSTPAHPACVKTLSAVKAECPDAVTVYGGVFPTYHAATVLQQEAAVDVVVRGEGEATSRALLRGIAATPRGAPTDALAGVEGLVYRHGRRIVETPPRAPIGDLDRYRVGWELLDDWDRYRCFGRGRAAIVQFSRGCPHRCTYCGQHGFWARWRYRDPTRVADEIAWLHRVHRVRFVTLADENPTTDRHLWRQLLEELTARDVDVQLFATIRASDIVRDAAILPLYHRAGLRYILMGIESTDDRVLREVRKGSSSRIDFRACGLLREHRIHSIIGHIVGLGNESRAGFRRAREVLARYDGDYLNAMYVTPHAWTSFADQVSGRDRIEPDLTRWDYRHQVLAEAALGPWRVFAEVKWLELAFHLRPRRLARLWLIRDRERLRQARWCHVHTAAVWFGEIADFLLTRVRSRLGRSPARRQGPAETRPARLPVTGALTGGDRAG